MVDLPYTRGLLVSDRGWLASETWVGGSPNNVKSLLLEMRIASTIQW